MDLPVEAWQAALLALIALVGGVGITAIGPGGVLVTIGLFLLTDLSPAEVAGTAIVTHIGTGLLGSLAYVRSGQLREPGTRALAVVLAATALVGTPLGALLNSRMSGAMFGVLLAVMVVGVGLTVLVRERRRPGHDHAQVHFRTTRSQGMLGGTIAMVSGIFGLGGPMLSVPALVIGGVPILPALAAAQGQSVIVATTGTLAYLGQGAISWPLAMLVGIPQLAGVVIGWRIAHALPRRPLTYALALTLVALGPVIGAIRLAG